MEKHQKSEEQHKRTGASNVDFDLFSEVHCLLKGNAALEHYIEDAREAGERDAENVFKAIQDQKTRGTSTSCAGSSRSISRSTRRLRKGRPGAPHNLSEHHDALRARLRQDRERNLGQGLGEHADCGKIIE